MTSRQNGFVLPLSLLLAVLAAALAFSLFQVSRQHVRLASFYSDKERAYHLAVGGLRIGREFLQTGLNFINTADPATFPKEEKAPDGFKAFVKWFIEHQRLSSGPSETFSFTTPSLQSLAKSQPGSNLEISLSRGSQQPIYTNSPAGFQANDQETNSQIILTCEAKLNSTGVKIQSFSWLKWVSVLPPVLGKFVFFLRQPDSLNLNSIKDSNESLISSPINIHSSLPTDPGERLEPSRLKEDIDRRGWIYLGSSGEYHLGLSSSGGNQEFSEPLDSRFFGYAVEPESFLGKNGRWEYHSWKSRLFKEANEEPYQLLKLVDENSYAYSCVLNLFGPSNHPSPTLVIGNVLRRILLIQGIFYLDEDETYPLPYLDADAFNNFHDYVWPGNVIDLTAREVIHDHFLGLAKLQGGTGYDFYKARMSRVDAHPYNEANLEFLKFPEELEKTAFPKFEISDPRSPPSLERIEVNGVAAPFHQPLVSGVVTIKNDNGEVLFKSADLNAIEDLEFLKDKAKLYANQDSLFSSVQISPSRISLGGVVYIDGSLLLEKPIEIAAGGGGILLVEKDIKIQGKISSSGGETLTLVSLQGNIELQTAQPVQAGLIALKGGISLPYKLDMEGILAAKKLSIQAGSGAVKREIKYNSTFDSTDTEIYKRSFKASVTDHWKFYVSGL
jgi:hypothetical protein